MKRRFLDFILIAVLVLLNIYFIYPIFQGEFTSFPLSIESVFLVDAKFIAENFPNISWYPFWYFGLPFYLVYQPIPIFLTAALSLFPYFSIGQSYRILTGFFLILGTIGVYFWARYLTKNKLAAFAGATAFSFLPSIAYVFLSDSWHGSGFIPLRLVNTLVYGEGPHMWGLAFLPFACFFYQKFLREPGEKINWIMTLVFSSIILLTSLTTFTGLLVFLFFIFWIEAASSKFRRKLTTSLILFLFIFGISFFWYSPEFLKAAFGYSLDEGGGIFSGVWGNFAFSLFVIPTFLVLLYILYDFLHRKVAKRVSTLFLPASLLVFLFFLIYGWFAWGAAIFPLPFKTIPRLIPELELAFALLLAAVVAVFPKRLSYALAGIIIVVTLFTGWNCKNRVWHITRPHEDFSETSEYVIAKKLDQIGAKKVYTTGTHAFWLNLFSNTTQLRGGKGGDFGGLNPWWAHLSYFINRGENGQLTEKWMKSLGFEYIVINYPGSPVYYHDFNNINRFDGFEEIFNYKGDRILKLPTKNTNLALALPKGWAGNIKELEDLSSGEIVLDEERLNKYFSFVEREGEVLEIEFPFDSWSKMRIPGDQVEANQEILIRQTYYPGWRAKSDGKKLKIGPDPVGFMRIENPGSSEIVLTYFPTGFVISCFISLVVFVMFVVFFRKEWQKELLK